MIQKKITISSPAKLNLFLHVYQQRMDQYHDLDTLFELVDLHDNIQIEVQISPEIIISNPSLNNPMEQDICFLAAKLLQKITGVSLGAKITVSKKIPIGGGLGGGSSNAASVLVGLNYLWQTKLSQEKLQQIGLMLGSDVPIFIYGKSARAFGRGEQFTALSSVPYNPDCYYVIANPIEHVSTQVIFNSSLLVKRQKITQPANILDCLYQNDFEQVVFNKYLSIKSIKEKMQQFSPAYLTGTGSCLYSVLDDKEKADKMTLALKRDCNIFVTKALTESPILKFV